MVQVIKITETVGVVTTEMLTGLGKGRIGSGEGWE